MYRHGPAGHGVVLHGVPEGRHHVSGDEPVEGLDQAEHAVHGDEEEEHDPVDQVQPGDLLPVSPQAWLRRGSRASGRRRRHPVSLSCSPRRPRRGGELLLPCAAAPDREETLFRCYFILLSLGYRKEAGEKLGGVEKSFEFSLTAGRGC